ncbi:glutamate-1-semialdehyde 2,1-aminomutase [Stratiformator vulcanicus]|uniref:Glutamate-1-semialdehyde 2,1-aminomutase n=1 Tax=Stratiformator vulcanicus TaxID=2527980 RepID=A0A517QZX6_9PLAN|nr:glutamate-1-semialdehyde 2,1-aminomutase [Stratiformator vulcanicus]QDT37205.1 Glutamate-1-semialdehyde 2,1-aminomutase [Stratiformator vulcanicus]
MPAPSKLSHEKSHAEFHRARKVIPGGVNSPARAFGAVGGEPVVMDRGDGPYLFDIDGNRYIDFIGSWGPHILGHRHPRVVEAIEDALKHGTSFGAPTHLETVLAEIVVDAVPSVEMVRMVNSGTEAGMSAIRVARGATGRDKVVKFAGCYHGHVDALLVQAGSGALTHGVPTSPGIPAGATADTIVLPYNDPQRLAEAFTEFEGQIAGVFMEPVVGNMGLVPPKPEFLDAARQLCSEDGTLLGFDEVMTGFRLSFGGAQELFGVTPDMTMLGKVIGGGMPVGAYGGAAHVMENVSPLGPVYQAGTLSGNPIAMASGIATLSELKETNPYPRLEALGARFEQGLREAATAAGIPHSIGRVGSMMTLFFTSEDVTDLGTAQMSDTARFGKFFWGMLERGIYLPCSQFEALFISAAHTEEHIDEAITAAREVLGEISAEA